MENIALIYRFFDKYSPSLLFITQFWDLNYFLMFSLNDLNRKLWLLSVYPIAYI